MNNFPEAQLFSAAEFKSLTGHAFTQGKDIVLVMNGDADANNSTGLNAAYWRSGNVWVESSKATVEAIRFEWIVFSHT